MLFCKSKTIVGFFFCCSRCCRSRRCLGLFETSCYCRAKVELNSINWVRHGNSTTFQTGLKLRIPVLRHCGSSRHNALFIISEKMASIRRKLQTGQTGFLPNAPYQQPRRATLKLFRLLLRCDDGLDKEPGNWLLSSYFYPTFVFSFRSV